MTEVRSLRFLALSLGILTALASGATFAGRADAASLRQFAAGEPLVFASARGVFAYSARGSDQKPLWYLTGAPLTTTLGLSVDGQRNLYVADNSGYVFEYDRPTASGPPAGPSFAYVDTQGPPQQVTACAGAGKTYIYATNQAFFFTNFTVWEKGKPYPIRVVQNSNYYEGQPFDIDCDQQGNVYFGWSDPSNFVAAIDEYVPGGTGPPTTLAVDFGYFANAFGIGAGDYIAAVAGGYYGNPVELWKKQSQTWTYLYSIGKVFRITDCAGQVSFEEGQPFFWIVDQCSDALFRMDLHGHVLDAIRNPHKGLYYLGGLAVSPSNRP